MNGRNIVAGLNHLNTLGRAVKHVFDSHPKLASACTGLVTFALGDAIVQGLKSSKDQKVNTLQSVKVGGLGFVMNGLFLTNWYNFLDRLLGSSMKNKTGVAMKVLADQFLYAPFSIISYFGFFHYIQQEQSQKCAEAAKAKIQNKLLSTWLMDCTLWPIANVVNFRFVPLLFRPIFTSFVQLIWQTYLAYVSGETKG